MRTYHKIWFFISPLGDCFTVNGHSVSLPYSMATMPAALASTVTLDSVVGHIVGSLAKRTAFISSSVVRELSDMVGIYLREFRGNQSAARSAIDARRYFISGKAKA